MKETMKTEAIAHILNGGKCVYRHGWGWKGAPAREITNSEAIDRINKNNYQFGMGFYTLNWLTIDGESVLELNELSECDMD